MILTLDLISSSASQFTAMNMDPTPLSRKSHINMQLNNTFNFVFAGISALMHFLTIFWAFTLLWKTFLFRFGLISRLFKSEFPLLFLIPLHFVLFAAEKGYRLVSTSLLNQSNIFILQVYYLQPVKETGKPDVWGTPISIHDDWKFQILFWFKSIIALIAYAGCIKTSIYVMHPSYYKPYRWFVL